MRAPRVAVAVAATTGPAPGVRVAGLAFRPSAPLRPHAARPLLLTWRGVAAFTIAAATGIAFLIEAL